MGIGRQNHATVGKVQVLLGLVCLMVALGFWWLANELDWNRPEDSRRGSAGSTNSRAGRPSSEAVPPEQEGRDAARGVERRDRVGESSILQRAVQGQRTLESSVAEATTPERAEIALLLASEDARGRFLGLRLLAQAAPSEAPYEILEYVRDTKDLDRAHLQRLAAVSLLGELENVPVTLELTALYETDEPGVRRAAALALSKHGDESLVERELFSLRKDLADFDGGVRARAAAEAAALAGPLAIPVLLPLLSDSNSDVRARAIDGISRSGDPLLVPELERLLEDPVAQVRERARLAIDSLSALAGR